MSMKAETVFGAAFIAALAFLAYCIFVLPPKNLRVAALGGSTMVQTISAHAGLPAI